MRWKNITQTSLLAAKPPMGWNSWDGYGTTVKEADVKANADWLAKHLKPFGWQYVVVDMGWFVTNPIPEGNSKTSQYSLDNFGRYVPAVNRFPSAANDAGFKPLADYVHSLGLKFGIHILRGIPKQAVEKICRSPDPRTMPTTPQMLPIPVHGTSIITALMVRSPGAGLLRFDRQVVCRLGSRSDQS